MLSYIAIFLLIIVIIACNTKINANLNVNINANLNLDFQTVIDLLTGDDLSAYIQVILQFLLTTGLLIHSN